jgi:peptide/nickel transport system permease protein
MTDTAGATLGPGGVEPALAGDAIRTPSGEWREVLRALVRQKTVLVGGVITGFWILDALFWRLIVPYNPSSSLFRPSVRPNGTTWFGTDDLGRDVFSRVLAGASSVLTVAPAATLLGLAGGVTIGLVSGYFGGAVDNVMMRIVDALLAFPLVILAVLVLSTFGASKANVIIVIGIVFAPIIGRTARSAVLLERDRDYVAAARLRGDPAPLIMFREILPNITGPLVVEATIRFGYAIFTSATLSFLGLGIQQPSPDWGLTIALGRASMTLQPWVVLFPGLALGTLVVGVNLLADGVKRVLED